MQRAFYTSIAIHIVVVVLLTLVPNFTGKSFVLPERRVEWIKLPKGTGGKIGVGFRESAGLPKTTIQQQKKKPVQKKKSAAMKLKKKMSKKEKEKFDREKKIEDALARIEKDLVERKSVEPEAGQLKEKGGGGIPEGDINAAGEAVDPVYAEYQMKIREQIMSEWILPIKYHTERINLVCKIVVQINNRGEVISIVTEETSGSEPFDQSALRAIESASPLALPPSQLQWEALNEGLLIEFNPKEKQ